MTEQITDLEKSWYLFPDWGQQIPPVEVNLWEQVYLKATRTFGFCSGLQWNQGEWHYFVEIQNEVIHTTKHQFVGTGRMEATTVKKPVFVVGDRVMLLAHAPGTKQRLVLGVQLVHRSWFYLVEWMSPVLCPTITMSNRFSLLREEDLVRVKV